MSDSPFYDFQDWQKFRNNTGSTMAYVEYKRLRDYWRDLGGDFHGPLIETATIPEANLLPLLQRWAAQ